MSRLTTAAALAATAVLLAGCGGGDGSDESPDASSPAAANVELTAPAEQSGRCMPPNVENLQAQDTAFEGVVTTVAVGDGTATLEVTQSFKGDEADTVTVTAPSQDLQDLLLAVDFEEGETYLVSSLDGQLSVCGLSGRKDDLLAELYQQAYRG
jgi:hypothetical protein